MTDADTRYREKMAPLVEEAIKTGNEHKWGIHHYRALASGCLRRYAAEVEQADDPDGDAAFGTALHLWLAHYHYGVPLPDGFTLSDQLPPKGYVSQATLAERYAKRFSAASLGNLLPHVAGPETRLSMMVTLPTGQQEPFAGTLDAPVYLTDDHCETLQRERGLTLPGPGPYNIDHKTKTRRSSNLALTYLTDPQFTGYAALWQANGGEPLVGTLVNILFRYKEDKDEGFVTLLVPPPDEQARLVWLGLIHAGADRVRRLGPGGMDATRCFEWGRACPQFDVCPRHNWHAICARVGDHDRA